MGRAAVAITLALLGACSFEPTGLKPGDGDGGADDAEDVDAPDIDAPDIDAPDAPPIDAAIDAAVDAPIDAPTDAPIDAPTCPGTYTGAYRYIPGNTTWILAEQDCENDQPGRTHLAVINNAAEGLTVITALGMFNSGPEVWVGVVRDPAATQWRWVTGGTAGYLPWGAGQPGLGSQLVVRVEKTTGQIFDRDVDDTLPALCECDGQPPVNANYDPNIP